MAALKRTLSRFVLLLAGLGAGVVGAEGVARFAEVAQGRELLFPNGDGYPADLYVMSDGIAYPNPEFSGEVRSVGYAVKPRFSPWGTRGDATPGTPAWITVGDSFTAAVQVNDPDTFSARLQSNLGTPVVNAGVDGYSTWKATMRYAQVAEHFPAEGAILGFFLGNDLFDNRNGIAPLGPDAPGASPAPGRPPLHHNDMPPLLKLSPFERFLHDNSAAWAWYTVAQRQRAAASGEDPRTRHFRDELELFGERARQLVEQEITDTRAALVQFREATQKRGHRAVVLVLPPAFTLTDEAARATLSTFGVPSRTVDLTTAHDAVLRVAQEVGLEACSPRDALVAAVNAGEAPYLLFDAHLSPRGHAIVADALAACLAPK